MSRLVVLEAELEEIQARVYATLRVYPETGRGLEPARRRLESLSSGLSELKRELSVLWERGFHSRWK